MYSFILCESVSLIGLLVSTYVVCERLSVMHKQVCVHIPQTVKFASKFSRKPISGISDRKAHPPKYPSPPNGLESGRSYVETNLYPPGIPLVHTARDWDWYSLLATGLAHTAYWQQDWHNRKQWVPIPVPS